LVWWIQVLSKKFVDLHAYLLCQLRVNAVKAVSAGIPGINTSARITREKCSLMNGMFPKKYPTSTKRVTHNNAPMILKRRNVRYVIRPMPAIKGANVLMIGRNRAITTVIFPYLS
jgi:hypothetical protein